MGQDITLVPRRVEELAVGVSRWLAIYKAIGDISGGYIAFALGLGLTYTPRDYLWWDLFEFKSDDPTAQFLRVYRDAFHWQEFRSAGAPATLYPGLTQFYVDNDSYIQEGNRLHHAVRLGHPVENGGTINFLIVNSTGKIYHIAVGGYAVPDAYRYYNVPVERRMLK